MQSSLRGKRLTRCAGPGSRRRLQPCLAVESLERRTLLDAMPIGTEIELASQTATNTLISHPAVAIRDNGDFVAAWQSRSINPATNDRVLVSRYNSATGTLSDPTVVASMGAAPAVAMDANGNYAVAWYQGELLVGVPVF